jgi:hypothetical protein
MVGAGSCDFSPIPGDGWLNLCSGSRRILVVNPGDEDGLTAFLGPDLSEAEVPMDQWVVATGHFDDPAASSCDREGPNGGAAGDPEQVELCRLAFILERVKRTP